MDKFVLESGKMKLLSDFIAPPNSFFGIELKGGIASVSLFDSEKLYSVLIGEYPQQINCVKVLVANKDGTRIVVAQIIEGNATGIERILPIGVNELHAWCIKNRVFEKIRKL